jgi:hypothetical protein
VATKGCRESWHSHVTPSNRIRHVAVVVDTYPLWHPLDDIEKVQHLGLDAALAIVKPSRRSIVRWTHRLDPYEMGGGKEHTQLIGQDQMIMAIYLVAYPDAERNEIAQRSSSQTRTVDSSTRNQPFQADCWS